MGKVFGIDLGTTYSCIAYIDENNKPVVLANAEGDLTTPSVVFFESPTDVTVGKAAKESAALYPDQVVSLIKRQMGKAGYSRNINGVDMTPEEISSYILKKVVQDAEAYLREQGKLEDGESVKDVVITCPAYFGVAEREATERAGQIAGLNVLAIINEPTAAAINYGITGSEENKTVLVYDLGGGTFDVTMINIKPGEIRVVCTGGHDTLGGRDWDERVLMYLAEQFNEQTGNSDNILEDNETMQELSLSAERAKKLLTSKEKAPVSVKYDGESARVELTREKFNELTDDLLTQTVTYTEEMFKEAEKKGFTKNDVSEILLVGGSSRMPQVMERIKSVFGLEAKMFDPDQAVAKGAAIYASRMSEFNSVLEQIAESQGKSVDEVKEDVQKGTLDVEKEAKKANIKFSIGGSMGAEKIINVSSRSFGLNVLHEGKEVLFNIILKNAELPATHTESFSPASDKQKTAALQIKESLTSEQIVDLEMGKEVGEAILELPAGCTTNTEIQVTFRLDESGLLRVHAVEMDHGREVDAEFQTKEAMTEEEKTSAIQRSLKSNVN